MSSRNDDVSEVIGFDLGHGETSLAWAALSSKAMPSIIAVYDQTKMITAIGEDAESGFVVGEKLFLTPNVKNPQIGFKQKPPGPAGYADTLRNFIAAYNKLLAREDYVKGGAQCYYFVGCPSGWSDDEVKEYEKMLASEAVPNIKVVRESRAALLQAKVVGKISAEQLKGSVIVIDIGSLTTDVTHVLGGFDEEVVDTGLQLGAGLIEDQIFNLMLIAHPQRDELIEFFNAPQNRLEEIKCKIACRRLKEEYWSFDVGDRPSEVPIYGFIRVGGKYDFRTALDSRVMDQIINEPLSELNNISWVTAFENMLINARTELDRKRVLPDAVVLTGGASRMSFIRKLCMKHFGEAAIIRHFPPEETVAMGLAQWGRIYLNTTSFSEEIDAFCEQQVPEIVRRHSSSLVTPLVEEVAGGLIQQVIEPVLRKWREGSIETLAEIDSIMEGEAETWMKSESGRGILATVITKNIRLVASDINDLTREICDKYSIPYASLRLNTNIPFNNASLSIAVQKPFDKVMNYAMVIGGIIMFIAYIPAKIALATGNVPGWVALLSLGGLASLFGPMVLKEKISGVNIPLSIREKVLTDEKITKNIEEAVPDLKKKIEEALTEEQLDNIIKAIAEHLKKELNERANEVKWIIS